MLWIDTEKQLKKYFEQGTLPIVVSVDKRHYDETIYKFLMHGHSNICELTVISDGAGLYQQGKEAYLVKKGDVLLYNCGELHTTQSLVDSGVDYYSIGITNLRKRGLPPDFLRNPDETCLLHAGEMWPVVQGYCEQLYYLLGRKSRDNFNDLAVQLLGASLVVLLDQLEKDSDSDPGVTVRRSSIETRSGEIYRLEKTVKNKKQEAGDKKDQPAVQIKAYLDKHYRESLTLAIIAEEMGYSETFVSHEFKKNYGISPMKYVINRRVSQAQLLLHSTDMKVNMVARKVGYDNTNYFITLFTRSVGMSPEKYREFIKKDVHSLV